MKTVRSGWESKERRNGGLREIVRLKERISKKRNIKKKKEKDEP